MTTVPARVPTTAAGSRSASTTSPTGAGGIPAGWPRYEDPTAGYALAHPAGWQVRKLDGTRTDLVDPATGTYLRVDWTDKPGVPIEAWRRSSAAFGASHPGYEELRLEETTFQGFDGALWEYRYSSGSGRLHASNLTFVASEKRAYALNFQTDDARWGASQALRQQLEGSFQVLAPKKGQREGRLSGLVAFSSATARLGRVGWDWAVGSVRRTGRQEDDQVRVEVDRTVETRGTGRTPAARRAGAGRRLSRLTVCLLVAGSVLAGCGSGSGKKQATSTAPLAPTSSLPVVVPAGFNGFVDAPDRFTMAVPADWQQVDPSSPNAAQSIQDVTAVHPAMTPLLSVSILTSGNVKFVAVDPGDASLSMIVKDAGGMDESDLGRITDQAIASAQDPTAVTREPLQLAGHGAMRLTSDYKLAKPVAGKPTLHQVQYFFVANDLQYVLTLTGASPQFPAIAETLRIG